MSLRLAIAFLAAVLTAHCAEPLVGKWLLERQEVDGRVDEAQHLTLRIAQSGERFTFAFSVPSSGADVVSIAYTVKLDGSDADVRNARGETIGTVQIVKTAASQYKLTLKGPNRPTSLGQLAVSADGKTMTSESDVVQGARSIHSSQTYRRDPAGG